MGKGVRNLAETFSRHVTTMYKTIFQIVFTLVLSSLSIASLWVGIARKSECPIQTKIPTWLIVYGSIGITTSLITIVGAIIKCLCCSSEVAEKGCDLCVKLINAPFGLFAFVWLILGSVWVFKVKPTVQFNDSMLNTYCEKQMFNFIFGIIIFSYSCIGLVCCCICCVSCLAILCSHDDDDDN
ncbi:hypothetical protein I4U23_004122 [Adineta vaga]|nr:hypothetical protein I4U23_004122 [Adineta vaga]